jgi:uncharacterized protein YodC (DUF2158 family)
MAFQPGDQVQLKSGGPAMTVESSDDQQTECVWFVSATMVRSKFNNLMLVPAGTAQPATPY